MPAHAAFAKLRAILTRTLPGSGTHTILILALFAAVQVADAALTAMGVVRYGPAIEANPIVASCIDTYGLLSGLCAAKAFAIGGGAILHATTQSLALVLLTVFCVFAALVPWAVALAWW